MTDSGWMAGPARHDSLRVAVVGAGAIGCAAAAFLARAGHAVALWSPTARRVRREAAGRATFRCSGAVEGEVQVALLADAAALADFPVVLVCLPADAYGAVLGPLAGTWRSGQHVVVSGALSLAPLWIEAAARGRGQAVQVTGWGTAPTTAHFLADGTLHANPLRQRIDIASVGAVLESPGAEVCRALFGDRFVPSATLLAPALANINPIAHAAEVIPNLTRMDAGEAWSLFGCFTPVVGRLAEGLDAERLAIAAGFGLRLPTLRQHYARSYHVEEAPLHEMAAQIVRRGMSPNGPATLRHRYVLEDAPFGLAFLECLGRVAAVATPVLGACLALLQQVYGRDFRRDNFLLDSLGVEAGGMRSLLTRCAAADNAASLAPALPLRR